jgi:catalase-peroxidase
MKIKLLIITSLLLTGCKFNNHKKTHHKESNHNKFEAKPNEFWWPKKINLSKLRKHSPESNPYDNDLNYPKEFAKIDLGKLKKEIEVAMKTSQDWWPADYGNYGPFFIRMAWHSAGTYRTIDGRGGSDGGQQRFEPLNSWPDNTNLDKARRLLWPIKQIYGAKISWADLMILSGNVALESMGFKTIGFAGGRVDDYEPDLVYFGPEHKFMASDRLDNRGRLQKPLGATTMGLIYVNPEGPNGNPDPLKAASQIRETFARMAMNDEETVALIAGGHTLGKTHGAHNPAKCVGKDPTSSPIEAQGLGWHNKCNSGKGVDAVTSGLEGAWTSNPIAWSHEYFKNLFAFDWVKTKSPGGAIQWIPSDKNAKALVPDAHDPKRRHAPIMLTTDLSLKFDPKYREISLRFRDNPKEFEKAFAYAWFKLTHRDMGPKSRYVGSNFPKENLIWQDPIPKANYQTINETEIANLKKQIANSKLSISQLVKTAWASASSFRSSDLRGGANGARIRLEPQKNWIVNNTQELTNVLEVLENIQINFNRSLKNGKKVSLADVIVLGGAVGIEKSGQLAGLKITVPFKIGRVDATQQQTDSSSFDVLDTKADGFRNYYHQDAILSPVEALIDKASNLDLTVPEMTALIGGMRVLSTNYDGNSLGVFTNKPGVLSNDFFVNLLDTNIEWKKSSIEQGVYQGFDRKTDKLKYHASAVDLVFGSSSELRAIAEIYGASDGKEKFVKDFIKAWNKVMNLDRFDLKNK